MAKASNIFDDPKLLRLVRDLCPKAGGGIEAVEFSVPGKKPVRLTAETRKRLNKKLREMQQRKT